MTLSKMIPALVLTLTVTICPSAPADDRSAADLLPNTTVVYAELPDAPSLLNTIETHPVRQRLWEIGGIREGFETKQFLELKAVVSIVEARLGKPWAKIAEQAAAGGVTVAVDAKTQGLAILIKAQDDTILPKIIVNLTELARADAKSKNNADPINEASYRDIRVYQVDQAKLACFGDWLVVTNKDELGKAILDQYLDRATNSLSQNTAFQQAKRGAQHTVWAYFDLKSLRDFGVAKNIYRDKSDNLVAELLLGGIMDVLRETPYVTAALNVDEKSAKLEIVAPSETEWLSEAREHYFGPEGAGLAPPLLEVDGEILSISSYRNLSQMWLRAGDLFDDSVNDGLAQADSNLSNLFAGRDFGEDILGAFRPELQLVVARQTFERDQPQPQLKLPAFALSWKLKDPAEMRAELRRTFQSAIGFLNVIGAMNGQPQLDQDIEKQGEVQLITASYLIDKDENKLDKLPINFNFSPSAAFVEDRFVLSSTTSLAREIVELAKAAPAESVAANTRMRSQMDSLATTLEDNRESLIAQNMLEEGHSREEAEGEIGTLLHLIDAIEDITLELSQPTKQLGLTVELTFSE